MLVVALLSLGIGSATPVTSGNKLIPGFEDFRVQRIQRVKGEDDWPFVAEKGRLLCAPSWQKRFVYFVADKEGGGIEYPFALDENMMTVALVNMGRKSALRPFDSFEQLLKRLSPYLAMGRRLCDQPAGSDLPESSL